MMRMLWLVLLLGSVLGHSVGGSAAAAQSARVVVDTDGFKPGKLQVKRGEAVTITFVRVTDATCAKEVVFPSLKITRALPLNKPVEVRFTPQSSGEIAFACGMDMLRGTITVN